MKEIRTTKPVTDPTKAFLVIFKINMAIKKIKNVNEVSIKKYSPIFIETIDKPRPIRIPNIMIPKSNCSS